MKQDPGESALVKTNQTGSSESSPFSKGAEDVNFGSLPIRFALFTPPSCFNMPCMASILEVRDLRVTYRSRGGPAFRALDGVSFSLESGEVLGVLGESGSGKSTLATSLLGLFCANALTVSGTVLFEGQDLLQAKPGELQKIRGNRISLIFQEPSVALHPTMRAGRQIRHVLAAHGTKGRRGRAEEHTSELQSLTNLVCRLPLEKKKQ